MTPEELLARLLELETDLEVKDALARLVRERVEEEREGIAKYLESMRMGSMDGVWARDVAAAIRARGEGGA